MKLGMSLDLAASEPQTKASTKQSRLNDMLATPDLGLFMLTSPDLERFIIQQNGMVLTTPTPTTQILFPKTVTEEQEAYARGFVDALGELHKNYGTPMVGSTVGTLVGGRPLTVSAGPVSGLNGHQKAAMVQSTMTTTTLLPGSILARPTAPAPQSKILVSKPNTSQSFMVQPKIEGAQTVPTFRGAIPATVTPINMDDQEAAKLDRKRARNRLAATRCRNRKLERISRLEDRVKELKGQNSQLAETAAALRQQVCKLKQNIIEHTQNGCQVMLTHNLM